MVGQPFDTIKTRLQVLGKGTIGAAGMPPEMVYNNGMDCVRKMVSHQVAQQIHVVAGLLALLCRQQPQHQLFLVGECFALMSRHDQACIASSLPVPDPHSLCMHCDASHTTGFVICIVLLADEG